MSDIVWKSFKMGPTEGDWEPASYNITWEDGREYGRWRRVLRQHRHGLTVISRYTAPPGKAWKIIGKALALGEEVYIMAGGYYNKAGRIIAGPGTFMFNAPGAIHGGISSDLTLYICVFRSKVATAHGLEQAVGAMRRATAVQWQRDGGERAGSPAEGDQFQMPEAPIRWGQDGGGPSHLHLRDRREVPGAQAGEATQSKAAWRERAGAIGGGGRKLQMAEDFFADLSLRDGRNDP